MGSDGYLPSHHLMSVALLFLENGNNLTSAALLFIENANHLKSEALLFFENANHLMNGQKEAEVEHDVQELVICCSTWLRPT